jgi:hypothetical protein
MVMVPVTDLARAFSLFYIFEMKWRKKEDGGLGPYVRCKLLVKSFFNKLNKKCCMHQFDAKARASTSF